LLFRRKRIFLKILCLVRYYEIIWYLKIHARKTTMLVIVGCVPVIQNASLNYKLEELNIQHLCDIIDLADGGKRLFIYV